MKLKLKFIHNIMYRSLVKVTEKDAFISELWLLLQKTESGVSNADIWFNCCLWYK